MLIGAHGEGSKDLLRLIDRMTERGAVRRHSDIGYASAVKVFGFRSGQETYVHDTRRRDGDRCSTSHHDQSWQHPCWPGGPAYTKAASARHRNARLKYNEEIGSLERYVNQYVV